MKLLLDSCTSHLAAAELRALGHDVVFAGEWDLDPGDLRILQLAHEERRVLITLDKDFGELAVVHRIAHAGIVRLVEQDADLHASLCERVLRDHAEALSGGAIITVHGNGRIRVRQPRG